MFVKAAAVSHSMVAFRFFRLFCSHSRLHKKKYVDDLSKIFLHAVQIWQMSEHIYEDEWKAEARQR